MPVTIYPTNLKYKTQNGQFQSATAIKGDDYVLTAQDKEDIAALAAEEVDVPVQDVQVDGTSIVGQNGVANVPMASTNVLGVAKYVSTYGIDIGTTNQHVGFVRIFPPTSNQVKSGNGYYNPITIDHQHEAAFYGLAKAAGDATQSGSSNPVGTYTNEAKSAIAQMLNGYVTINGTTPTITALPDIRYICGEVTTLTINPPMSGDIEVIFESGTTATILTVPSTVKFPDWFDVTALEANRIYDIIITNGTYGVVASWA